MVTAAHCFFGGEDGQPMARIPDDQIRVTLGAQDSYSCPLSAKCTASQCPAAGDWVQLPGEITLPGSFLLPRVGG